MNQQEEVKQLLAIHVELQAVIEKHLGTAFIDGTDTPAERAIAISTGIASCQMLLKPFVGLALLSRMERAPADPKECEVFINRMVQDLTSLLQLQTKNIVQESMEDIAFAVLTQVDPKTPVQ
jgi:hypothetical protein